MAEAINVKAKTVLTNLEFFPVISARQLDHEFIRVLIIYFSSKGLWMIRDESGMRRNRASSSNDANNKIYALRCRS